MAFLLGAEIAEVSEGEEGIIESRIVGATLPTPKLQCNASKKVSGMVLIGMWMDTNTAPLQHFGDLFGLPPGTGLSSFDLGGVRASGMAALLPAGRGQGRSGDRCAEWVRSENTENLEGRKLQFPFRSTDRMSEELFGAAGLESREGFVHFLSETT